MYARLSGDPATAPRRAAAQGLVCSLVLHSLFGVLVVLLLMRPERPELPLAPFLPVDLVRGAPLAPAPVARKAVAPDHTQTRPARVVPSSPRRPVALAPARRQNPPDALEIRLKELARLRQPVSTISHPDNGAADEAIDHGHVAGADAAYRVRDFLRAQVERRWSLDLAHARHTIVRIHVVVARDGRVVKAEIVDRARLEGDAAWRAVALSARNAVLLSSPLRLPAGASAPLDVTLAFDPDDALK